MCSESLSSFRLAHLSAKPLGPVATVLERALLDIPKFLDKSWREESHFWRHKPVQAEVSSAVSFKWHSYFPDMN